VEIKVEIKDEVVKSMLERIISRTRNATPVMNEIGAIVRRSIIRNFQEGGRPTRWKPLAVATILKSIRRSDFTKKGKLTAQASKRLQGGVPLTDTGTLRNSISYKAYPDKVTIGPKASIPYAAIHQLGGQAGRGHKVTIPARPYLMVQDEDWLEIRKAMIKYITEGAL